jgi:hypothetical protein
MSEGSRAIGSLVGLTITGAVMWHNSNEAQERAVADFKAQDPACTSEQVGVERMGIYPLQFTTVWVANGCNQTRQYSDPGWIFTHKANLKGGALFVTPLQAQALSRAKT